MKKKILIMSLLLISALAILIKTVFPHLLKEEALVTVVSERDMESAVIRSTEMPGMTTDAEMAAIPEEVNTETAAEEKTEEIPEETDAHDGEELAKVLYQAQLRLFAEIMLDEIHSSNYNKHPNLCYVTLSNMTAFAMLENGAEGIALEQMASKIFGGMSIGETNNILSEMTEGLKNLDEAEWNISNAIMYKNDYQNHNAWKLTEDYVQCIKDEYGGDVTEQNYDDNSVNKFVSDHTNGGIPWTMYNLWPHDGVLAINTMTFEGAWMDPYDAGDVIGDWEFTNADKTISDVTMLCSEEDQYFAMAGGVGFLREYKGGEYSFMGLLPEKGIKVEDYLITLVTDKNNLAEVIRNGYSGKVIVQIPEFSMDCDTSSDSYYYERGMDVPYQIRDADFSKMIKPDCYTGIDKAEHTTHIDVDQNGTEAMAATVLELAVKPVSENPAWILFGESTWHDQPPGDIDQPPVEIILDRPFIYGIIDNKTGMPVILGMVNHL